VYEELKNVLFQDSAVAGEAAGYAMGLVMLGSGSEKALDEMLQYAHETQHEKIIRGLAVGIGFLMYGKAQAADEVVERLSSEKVCSEKEFLAGGQYKLKYNLIGCYSSLRCYVCHRPCICWYGQQ
jgi:hypothetical protein